MANDETGNKIVGARQGEQKLDPNIPEDAFSGVRGVGGEPLAEDNFVFAESQNEKIITKGDSHIVLGKDRPASIISGFNLETNANSIDLVVGRISVIKKDFIGRKDPDGKPINKKTMVDPDFRNDAARIHISQKTDIDKNNSLVWNPKKDIPRSGITIKADRVVTVARSGIQLVSSVDSVNSHGLQDKDKVGVDLICGEVYDTKEPNSEYNKAFRLVEGRHDLQPIPKGQNLHKALEDIARQLDGLSGAFVTYVNMQMEWNNFMATHTHTENFYGLPGYPSKDMICPNIDLNFEVLEKTIQDIAKFKMQYLTNFRSTYLNPGSDIFINSRFHRLN